MSAFTGEVGDRRHAHPCGPLGRAYTSDVRRLWGERSSGVHVGLAATLYVWAVAAGDLTLQPLMRIHAATLLLLGLATLALWSARSAPWHRPVPLTLLTAAGIIAAWLPNALSRAPDAGAGRAEAMGLASGVAVAVTVVALSRGRQDGVHALRRGWLLGLLLALLVGAVELATDQHLWADPGLGWAEESRTIIAGAFRNPNDSAIAMTAMICGTLSWAATRSRSARQRLGVTAAVMLGVVAVTLTESRSGLLTVVLVVCLHAWGFLRRVSAGRSAAAASSQPRGLAVLVAAAVAVAVVLALAAFTVPALASRNPIIRLLHAAADPGTARSDSLRVSLLRAGWRYFAASDGFGTGAASFEPLLEADPYWRLGTVTWLHNSFLELLLQYGIFPACALAAVMAVVLITVVRSPAGVTSDLARIEALCALTTFVALGCAAATALTTPVWWLMLGQATASTWWLSNADNEPCRCAKSYPPREFYQPLSV